MKTQNEWLDLVAEKLAINSDYALAKALNISRQAISKYRNENRLMDNYTASKIAVIVGVEPMQVIADIELAREKDGDRRDWWEVYSKRFNTEGVGLLPTIFLSVSFLSLIGDSRIVCILCKILTLRARPADQALLLRN